MPSSRITRRRVGFLGATALAGFAGCNVFGSDDDELHTLHVAVEADDELVHWHSHDLGVSDSDGDRPDFVTVDPTWDPGSPAEYVVHGRLDDATAWNTDDLTKYPKREDPDQPECWGIQMAARSDGVTILATPNPDDGLNAPDEDYCPDGS